ncbi:ORF6C domain-containing protein [Clostridium botulinum]|uniref:ORF6C domain-containing protein n=1 Tax=Clostridium botulinum TaxID=1491 RepID=UPI00174AC2EB|nr:ORF6C domain-containing protein [Clostridium botulinum]MBD5642730.1 ORF6C domain-containing protein [Clostridium botulinum]
MKKIDLTIQNGQLIAEEKELAIVIDELIPVYENNKGSKLVNARELHEWLGNKDNFTTWIGDRIKQYEFIEDVDYISFLENSKKPQGGRPSKEFIITLNTAKELSMVERTKKGKQARKYFIKCEEKLKEVAADPYKGLSPELKAVFILDKKTQQIEEKVNNLESNMPLFNVECKELQALVRKIGTKILGGYRTPAYKDNSIRGKVYTDIQGQLKRQFGVSRYEAIKRSQLDTAKEILENYTVPIYLEDQIINVNNQVSF